MTTHTLERLPKNTVVLNVTIPWSDIQSEYGSAFDVIHKEFVFEGFRKGKVPKEIAEKHISKVSVYQQLIRTILPTIYDDIVKKEDLKPIISPKIDLTEAKENEDWKIKITLAEKPLIDLGDYKTYVKEAKAETKKDEIWVPGKEPQKEETPDQKYQKTLNAVLGALMEKAKVEISDVILEEEVTQRLSRLLDDIRTIGLTVEAYLKSKNQTLDDLRALVAKDVEETYKMEFILMDIADKEGIQIGQEDMDKLFGAITDEKDRKAAQENAYFYASVLRKQKTLDYLTSL